jgi:predicted DNA-binding transcriptional regulator AlpA
MSKRGCGVRIPDPLPEWFGGLPNNAFLSADELARLFGISRAATFDRIKKSGFPSPIVRATEVQWVPGRNNKRARWLVGDVRTWIAKRRAEGSVAP